MEIETLGMALPKFVEQVRQIHKGNTRSLTINDLRNSIRIERLTEIGDWSTAVLDAIEVRAARLDGSAPLESVLTDSTEAGQLGPVDSIASICGPSPVAWM